MLISELGRKSAQLQNSKLQNFKLWNKNTNEVLPLDIVVYLKAMREQGEADVAKLDIEELQRVTLMAILEGRLNDAPYLSFSGEKVKMTLGDFACILHFSDLSQTRRKAILFALETGMLPEDIVVLSRNAARKMKHTTFSRSLAESMPPCVNVNYLFWEEFEAFGMPGPLYGLSQDAKNLFSDMKWAEVVKLYRDAALVDTNADATEFLEIISTFSSAFSSK